jgi:hypothetical protein
VIGKPGDGEEQEGVDERADGVGGDDGSPPATSPQRHVDEQVE